MALSEFIEDCIYENLQSKVIYFIGEHGPQSSNPVRLVRYIYNRLILEKPSIRAASISALYKFGKLPSLQQRIQTLLEKSLDDKDDEIRERTLFYINSLSNKTFNKPTLPLPISKIEQILENCKVSGKPFSFDVEGISEKKEEKKSFNPLPEMISTSLFHNIAELDALGTPDNVTSAVCLTEKNAEYVVNSVCYSFSGCLVLEFTINNTLSDVSLSDVTVSLHVEGTSLESLTHKEDGILMYPSRKIDKNSSGVTYLVLKKLKGSRKASIPAMLKYKVTEYQGDSVLAVFDDEYQIENIQIELA